MAGEEQRTLVALEDMMFTEARTSVAGGEMMLTEARTSVLGGEMTFIEVTASVEVECKTSIAVGDKHRLETDG